MTKFKIVIGTKSGKTVQKELNEDESKHFLGKLLKEMVKGELVGFPGYEFLITGGSDYCGFPMRWDVNGTARQKILAVAPTVGLKKRTKSKKSKIRKLVCGNTIHDKIAQINLKVIKQGPKPLIEVSEKQSFSEHDHESKIHDKKKEEKAEEVVEKKAEEVKEEKKEEKPVEKKEEKKTEEKVEKFVQKTKDIEAGKKEPSAEELLKEENKKE